MMRSLFFALTLAASAPALAGGKAAEPEDEVMESVTGVRPPTLRDTYVDHDSQIAYNKSLEAYKGKEYPAFEYVGAAALSVDPTFVHDVRIGLEKVYQRDYKAARTHFEGLNQKYPGAAILPCGQILVWQSMMMENVDFAYESQYNTAHKEARHALDAAQKAPGNEAWENVLLTAVVGVEAIHQLRHEELGSAFKLGLEAMGYADKVKQLAPNFVDIQLATGLFNYWASSIALTAGGLDWKEDKRAEGITQMKRVEGQGTFLRPAASLALTLTWLEEGKKREALQSGLKNQRQYPANVVNNIVLSRVFMHNGAYADAERVLKAIATTSPENTRVNYLLGLCYFRWEKLPEADAALDQYLAVTGLDPETRGQALYIKGRVAQKRKDTRAAKDLYKEAWKVGKVKKAKERLEKMD